MSSHPDIDGREFDWFAVDRKGCVALLATAGSGPVPLLVRANYQEHDRVSEIIPCINWGSDKVWDSYAAMGLYVYDWNHRDKYLRRRVPHAPILDELRKALERIASMPCLDLDFEERESVVLELSNDT
jgi:hypothetical protein